MFILQVHHDMTPDELRRVFHVDSHDQGTNINLDCVTRPFLKLLCNSCSTVHIIFFDSIYKVLPRNQFGLLGIFVSGNFHHVFTALFHSYFSVIFFFQFQHMKSSICDREYGVTLNGISAMSIYPHSAHGKTRLRNKRNWRSLQS